MKNLLLIASLALSTQAFAGTVESSIRIGEGLKTEARSAVGMTYLASEAKSMRTCILNLSSEEAAANSAQLVEVTNAKGQKSTIAFMNRVSAAGLSVSTEIRIYQGEEMSEASGNLSGIAEELKTKSLEMGLCDVL